MIFALDLTRKINLKTFKIQGEVGNRNERIEWQEGMPLPPPPVFVNEPTFHYHYRQDNQSDDESEDKNDETQNNDENSNNNDGINNIEDNDDNNEEPIIQNINIE